MLTVIFRNFLHWLNRVFFFFSFLPGRLCGCLFAQFGLSGTPRWTVSFFYCQYIVHGYLHFAIIKRKCSYLLAIINQSNEPWSRPTRRDFLQIFCLSMVNFPPLSKQNQNESALSHPMIQEASFPRHYPHDRPCRDRNKKLIERQFEL